MKANRYQGILKNEKSYEAITLENGRDLPDRYILYITITKEPLDGYSELKGKDLAIDATAEVYSDALGLLQDSDDDGLPEIEFETCLKNNTYKHPNSDKLVSSVHNIVTKLKQKSTK